MTVFQRETAKSTVGDRLTFWKVLFWFLQLHMGSLLRRFSEGSPSRERAIRSGRASADSFLLNAEVQAQTCRCIPPKNVDTFTTTLPGQPPPPPPPPQILIICTAAWKGNCGGSALQEPLKDSKILKVSESAEGMWGRVGVGGGG